jgi:hypothetical protein
MIGFIGTSLQLQLIITAHILNSLLTTSVWRISMRKLSRLSKSLGWSLASWIQSRVQTSELFHYWRFTANQFVLATSPLRLTTRIFIFQQNICGYSPYVSSSLTRGWICCMQLMLDFASAVILKSESHGTHDHILLSQIRDSSNLMGQVPVYISLMNSLLNWVLSLMLTTDGQPASLSWNKAPIWGLRPDLYYCVTVTDLFLRGSLSDERSGLSFVCAAGLCQRSLSRVRVPWDLRPYFTAQIWDFPFCRLLRLARSRWRYSTPPSHGPVSWILDLIFLYNC